MDDLREEICQRVMRHCGESLFFQTAVPRLSTGIATSPTAPCLSLCEPMACIVLQGAKEVLIGDTLVRYEAGGCFANSVDLHAIGRIVEAKPAAPYVAVGLSLDTERIRELQSQMPTSLRSGAPRGYDVVPATIRMLEALNYLLKLLERPEDIPTLARYRERELLYYLFRTGHGAMLCQIASRESHLAHLRESIAWMKMHFKKTVRTEEIASIAGMSVATFHRHFKAATAMSPLQYQKSLRLQDARRLINTGHSVATVAYEVGYESPSHFTRDYMKHFGILPSQDGMK